MRGALMRISRVAVSTKSVVSTTSLSRRTTAATRVGGLQVFLPCEMVNAATDDVDTKLIPKEQAIDVLS
jgi:hypothetical protein